MSGPSDEAPSGNGVPPTGHETGVLAGLPRTRPQRASARRDAARRVRTTSARAEEAPSRGKASDRSARKTEAHPKRVAAPGPDPDRRAKPRPDRPSGRPSRHTSRIRVVEEPVPRQGFACEEETASGPVQPPGGTEFVSAAAEALGEVAKASLATGERLLKDVLSLLPRG